MTPDLRLDARAFLGRRSRCGAGGNSMGNTGPEGSVPRAASGGAGGRLRRPGGDAGEGRARPPSQTVGPFYAIGLCRRPENELVPRDHPGAAVQLIGQLLDGEDVPIGDGVIELWDGSA